MKQTLSDFLKNRIREIPKMSIRNLERKSGVSNSEICKIINGSRRNPNPHLLRLISKPLKADYKFLYYLAGYLDYADWKKIEKAGKQQPDIYTKEIERVTEKGYTLLHIHSSEEKELVEGFKLIADVEIRSDILRHLRLALRVERSQLLPMK